MKNGSWPINKRRATCALVLGCAFLLLKNMSITNVCETSPNHAEERLRTRRFDKPLKEVAAAAVDCIGHLRTYGRAWNLRSTDIPTSAAGDIALLHVEVPVIIFTDDLKVTMQRENNGVIINVRSASRIGRGDFGENRRHVLQFLNALDGKLK